MAITLKNGYVEYGDSTSQNTKEQCSAWCRMDYGNLTGGYKISSTSRLGAGNYRINFSTPFLNSNYSMIASSTFNPDIRVGQHWAHLHNTNTTYADIIHNYLPDNNGDVFEDCKVVTVCFFGDQ